MPVTEPLSTTPQPNHRWFHPTPDRFLTALLALEGLLLLSKHFRWFPFNEHKGWTVLIAVAALGMALLFMLSWFAVGRFFRRRFPFSIRSLLVLVVVVAVPGGWLAVEMTKAREQKEVVKEIEEGGGWVGYDCQPEDHSVPPGKLYCPYGLRERQDGGYEPEDPSVPPEEPFCPHWLLELLGDDFFFEVVEARIENDADLEHLTNLTQLKRMFLDSTHVTDVGLVNLKDMTRLNVLYLGHTRVTDAGLANLKGLSQLRELWLNNTSVTDAGLEHVTALTHLKALSLVNTQVTDAGLQRLKGLKQLQWLWLGGTRVTYEGLDDLRLALPGCMVLH
jgi:hypothetical protein